MAICVKRRLSAHHSCQPPCSKSSSAFSTLMDLQNSLVPVSHRRARPSVYTSSRLFSPRHTRLRGAAEAGTRYTLQVSVSVSGRLPGYHKKEGAQLVPVHGDHGDRPVLRDAKHAAVQPPDAFIF